MKKIITRIKLMFHTCDFDDSVTHEEIRPYNFPAEYYKCKYPGCNRRKWLRSSYVIALLFLAMGCSEPEEEENYCIYQRDSKVITDATQIGQVRYVYAGCSPNKTAKSILSENCTCPTNPGF